VYLIKNICEIVSGTFTQFINNNKVSDLSYDSRKIQAADVTLFFALKRPDWALIEVVFLWLSILMPMIVFWRFARPASLYLLPYLLWVSFAAFLNLTVVRLNAPFA